MNRLCCLIVPLAIFLSGCGSNTGSNVVEQKADDEPGWVFEKVDSNKLVFKDGKVFETELFNLQYIGQIPVEGQAPFLIFSGVDCDQCDANDCIYIHSPDEGKLSVGHGQNCYSFPGRETDYETNSKLLYEGRAFYGEVLAKVKGVIWFQKTLLENEQWKSIVFLTDVSGKSKIDMLLTDNGQLNQTLSLMKKGLCKEIPGREYSSEP